MKILAMTGILLFVGIGSAGAQGYAGGTSVGSGSSLNNGGGINAAGSMNGAVTASNSTVGTSSPSSQNIQATNPGEFVPSTFQNYPAAVIMGEEAGRMHPLTVVEAAKLAQQAKTANASKPTISLEKDAEGKLVIVDTKPVDSKPAQEKQ